MGLVSEYLENKRDIDVLAFRDSMHHLSTLTLILGIILAILSYFNQWYFMLAIINIIISIFFRHWYQDAQAEISARRWTAYKGNKHG
jgi:membrane glycosyltransferase